MKHDQPNKPARPLGIRCRRAFMAAWCRLAKRGSCDQPGGAEFRRVYAEWLAADEPLEIEPFIKEAANRPPEQGTFTE